MKEIVDGTGDFVFIFFVFGFLMMGYIYDKVISICIVY